MVAQDTRLSGGVDGGVGAASVHWFQQRLIGELIRPGDDGYDAARQVWNGAVDRHPAFIVRCRDAADVLHAVCFARKHDLPWTGSTPRRRRRSWSTASR